MFIPSLSLPVKEKKFVFTYPKAGNFDYSFSGLKTQFLNFIKKESQNNPLFIQNNLNDICASYQSHLVRYLLKVLEKAIEKYPCNDIALAGGVSANSKLRNEFEKFGSVVDHAWEIVGSAGTSLGLSMSSCVYCESWIIYRQYFGDLVPSRFAFDPAMEETNRFSVALPITHMSADLFERNVLFRHFGFYGLNEFGKKIETNAVDIVFRLHRQPMTGPL